MTQQTNCRRRRPNHQSLMSLTPMMLILLLYNTAAATFITSLQRTSSRLDRHFQLYDGVQNTDSNCDDHLSSMSSLSSSQLKLRAIIPRRNFVTLPTSILGASILMSSFFPQKAFGTNDVIQSNSTTRKALSATDIANLLHAVPTFTIVDPDGVPYMVVGEDARVTGYFFTTFNEAQRILTLAKTSVDQSIREEQAELKRAMIMATDTTTSTAPSDLELLINPWTTARISTLPLDVAITLSLKGLSGNVRTYFQVAAAASDIEDALVIANKTDLAEGKVPMFYFTDFTVDDNKVPLYFQKDQLILEYHKQNPRQRGLPSVQVTELFAVLTSMAKTTSTMNTNSDNYDDLQNIIFVPPMDSELRAKQCITNNKGKSPFVLGKRNIVL